MYEFNIYHIVLIFLLTYFNYRNRLGPTGTLMGGGVGVGGHCIPVDPYYMMQRAADVGVPAELITAARAVNRTMPLHVAGVLNDVPSTRTTAFTLAASAAASAP